MAVMQAIDAHRRDLAVRILSPEMAADKLGWTLEAVIARRATLGLGRFIGRRNARPQAAQPAKGKRAMRGKTATAKGPKAAHR
jgi:hypothetical protein